MSHSFLQENSDFVAGGTQHIGVITFTIVLSAILIIVGIHHFKIPQKNKAFKVLGYLLSFTIVSWTMLELARGKFDYQEDLPFVLCNILALLIPLFTNSRDHRMFEVVYFWVTAATFQAIITPDLENGFPHYTFFKYWIVHLGLLVIVFYAIFVLKMRPYPRSIFRAFIALEIYFILMILVNWLLGTNYFYVIHKPEVPSVLDLFGQWPWYIVVVQLIAIPFFFICYAPFYLVDKWKNRGLQINT